MPPSSKSDKPALTPPCAAGRPRPRAAPRMNPAVPSPGRPNPQGGPMRHAVVIEAVRTPIGRAHPDKGIYRDVRADDLSADLLRALLDRAGLPPEAVEDIHWGCVKQH